LQFSGAPAFTELRAMKLKPELAELIDGGWRKAMSQPAGEDVLTVLASAIHAVATTHDYQSAVFKAIHKAKRPASVAAVCGALAGALYGAHELPIVWRETLPGSDQLLRVSGRLLSEMPARDDQAKSSS
jgi:ADP-ribosylglycohydrolase